MTELKTLADHLRHSESSPLLLMGPPAKDEGWVYRDFSPMPQAMWIEFLDTILKEDVKVVAASSFFLPPAERCRAQIWIGPKTQKAWADYLAENP